MALTGLEIFKLLPNTNCGDCGVVCNLGKCVNGQCQCYFTALPKLCGKSPIFTCVDPNSDNYNCGGCGRTCDSYHPCSNGVCGGTSHNP